jgi:hypothetical protein
MLWVELLSRHGEVLSRHRAQIGTEAGAGIGIGRGYDNDVIIDDAYVAAHHLRLVRGEHGGLVAEDLGSANGLFIGEEKRPSARVALDGERIIRIGRTRLRVREAGHAVAPERVARPRIHTWPLSLALLALCLGLVALEEWLGQTGEAKLATYLSPVLALALFVLAWSTAWSVVSRIFTGRARFERNLLIAVCGLLALQLLDQLGDLAAFALSRREFATWRFAGMWLVAATVCVLHLRGIGESRQRLKAAVVGLLALTGIGMQTLTQWESRSNYDPQSYVRRLKPPTLRLAAPQSPDAFFGEVAALKPRLDRVRSVEPTQETGDSVLDDD